MMFNIEDMCTLEETQGVQYQCLSDSVYTSNQDEEAVVPGSSTLLSNKRVSKRIQKRRTNSSTIVTNTSSMTMRSIQQHRTRNSNTIINTDINTAIVNTSIPMFYSHNTIQQSDQSAGQLISDESHINNCTYRNIG